MKKITLLFIVLLTAIGYDSQAQTDFYTVVVNNNSTSGNGRAPQGARVASRSVWIVTADELAAAGFTSGSDVNSLGFNLTGAQDIETTGTMQIYLENTTDITNTKSNTWATAITGMTTVSDGSVTIPNTTGTFDIPFTGGSPFTYSGGGLYVAFDYQNFDGPLAAVPNVALCNNEIPAGLKGLVAAVGATTPPATVNNSDFRPETRLGMAVVCSRPSNLGVGAVTFTTAEILFDAGAGAVEMEYGPFGFAPGSGTTVSNVTSPFNLTGLDPNMVYDFYVRKDCGVDGFSIWAGPFAFNTQFDVAEPAYTTSFEQFTFPFVGWLAVPDNTPNGWFINQSAALAHDGDFEAVAISPVANAASERLYSRGINLTAGSEVTVDYFVRNFVNGSTNTASYELTVGSSQEAASQTTLIASESDLANVTYEQKTYTFSPTISGPHYFSFLHTSPANAVGTQALLVDSFTVTQVLGTSDFLTSQFSVYPNPARNVINIANGSDAAVSVVEITDMNGRVVKKNFVDVGDIQISVSDLASGVYMMNITTDKGTVIKKIVKE